MAVTSEYQGFKKTVDSSGRSVQETFVGFKQDCIDFMAGYTIGQIHPEYGKLDAIDFEQGEGPFWKVILNWLVEKSEDGSDNPGGYGQKASSLTIRMLSLPLERAEGYVVRWNYALAATEDTTTVPYWWETAKDFTDADNKTYKWVKSPSELQSGWKILRGATKPGIESYDFPIYELTENSRHNGKTSAGNAVVKKAGKIADPEYGDFGVKNKLGGDWLCEGGSISYNRKRLDSKFNLRA